MGEFQLFFFKLMGECLGTDSGGGTIFDMLNELDMVLNECFNSGII